MNAQTSSHLRSSGKTQSTSSRDQALGDGVRMPRVIWRLVMTAGVALMPLALPLAGHAQPAAAVQPGAAAVQRPAPKPPASGPTWAELQPTQQQALRPLAQSWDTISEPQKRKWLQVSRGYGNLSPQGQATMHSRMNDWVLLSPQQRAQARLNFAQTRELSRQLTPEEKKAKWQSYQALSAEEKQKLAATAAPRPAGAATAVKPVPAQKLTAVPPRAARAASAPGSPAAAPALKIAPSQPTAGQPVQPRQSVQPQPSASAPS